MNARDPNCAIALAVSHDGSMAPDVFPHKSRQKGIVLGWVSAMVLALLAMNSPAFAKDSTGNTHAESKMNSRLAKRAISKVIGSDISYVVMDAATSRIVSSRNADKAMLPASNMKIVTATNALSTMSPTKVFTTSIFSGPTPNSVVLQGGGDPLLTKFTLKTLASQTAALIDPTEPLIVDTDVNLFPKATDGPGWTKGYIPSVISPVTSLALYGDYTHTPIENAVTQFIDDMNALGIHASRGLEVDVSAQAQPLTSVSPHTVTDAVHVMLLDSENNIAENLFRHVALATQHPPTWQGSSDAAIANLNLLGVDTAGLRLADGSGVSREDRLNALSLAVILRLTSTIDAARFAVMFDSGSLPTAGVDGTLKAKFHRFTSRPSSCARGEIRAKTGTLHDTITLSGTTHDADGQLKVFSFLVNDQPANVIPLRTRQAIDGLAATITGCW